MNNTLATTGRIIFGIPFLIFGLFHFINGSDMAGMVPGWIPGGIFWVWLTGVALIAAAISIFTKRMLYWAGILLAVMLGIFILTVHIPGLAQNPQATMPNILKDLALAGAALLLAGVYPNRK